MKQRLLLVVCTIFCVNFLVACGLLVDRPGSATATSNEALENINHFLPSTPSNLSWGWFPVDKPPALTIESGDVVEIQTLTSAGIFQDWHPIEELTSMGIPAAEIPSDLVEFWKIRESRPREGRAGHLVTGPVYVKDAEPGDTLEIQILDVQPRVPWGINFTQAFSGVMAPDYPGYREGDSGFDIPPEVPEAQPETWRIIRTEQSGNNLVGVYPSGIKVPLAPFMGILAVSPLPVLGEPGVKVEGVQSSGPPGAFGGNLDIKHLTKATKLYLPVFQAGARFYVGDPHGAQGDGEVSGTAIEQSMTGVFRLVLHKDMPIQGPIGESQTHHLIIGIDIDLNRALRNATKNVVDFLVSHYKVRPSEAFSIASVAVDFTISEAVDGTQVVTALVPKSIFANDE